MKPRAFIGIDPGRTGAAALIHRDGCIVADWPGGAAGAVDLSRVKDYGRADALMLAWWAKAQGGRQ